MTNDELAKSYPTIRAHRSDQVREVWAKDPQGRKGEIIQQRLEETPVPVPARVAILIDGSSGMRQSVPAIAQALAKLPDQIEYGVWMASEAAPEGALELSPMGRGGSQALPELSDRLRRADYRGGIDNLPALGKAWDLAARNADSAVIWIHEPVPILLSATDGLVQRLERRPDGPWIFDLQTADGPNRISEALDGLSAVHSVTRTGNLNQDLERLFTGWRSGATRLSFRRERIAKPGLRDGASETSSHLARLWAFDEVNRILAGGGEGQDQEAVKLASSYQLVTPVTGAVVLETKEQYRNAGLEPVKPGTVPTIPEPEEWLLMIVVAIVLTWAVYRRRATCRTA